MPQVMCPFCLIENNFEDEAICPNCSQEIPQIFIDEFPQVPIIWLTALGFSKHGKTCYLSALSLLLEYIHKAWPGVAAEYLGNYTISAIRRAREHEKKGILPPSSGMWGQPEAGKDIPYPMLIRIHDLPKYGTCYLVITDTAGEYFHNLENFKDEGFLHLLKNTETIWFFISRTDLDDPQANEFLSMEDLIRIYLQGMRGLKWDTRDRNLVVVYTKVDRYINDLDEDLQIYYSKDPYKNLTRTIGKLDKEARQEIYKLSDEKPEIDNYELELRHISMQLRNYTIKNGGAQFITLAEKAGLKVYFTMTSSLGAEPEMGRMNEENPRYRIIDPLIWAMELHKYTQFQGGLILLDATLTGKSLYEEYDLSSLVKTFRDKKGKVITYFMGQSNPTIVMEKPPLFSLPDRNKPRLIGPILKKVNSVSPVLVFTSGNIEDLDDYLDSKWEKYIFRVTTEKDPTQYWPNSFSILNRNQFDLVNRQFRLFLEQIITKQEM